MRSVKTKLTLTILTALIILVGCGTPSKTPGATNSTPTISGKWSGTFTSSTGATTGLSLNETVTPDGTGGQPDGAMRGTFTFQAACGYFNGTYAISDGNADNLQFGDVTGLTPDQDPNTPPVNVMWGALVGQTGIQFVGQTTDGKTMTGIWMYTPENGTDSTCMGTAGTSSGNSFTLTKQ